MQRYLNAATEGAQHSTALLVPLRSSPGHVGVCGHGAHQDLGTQPLQERSCAGDALLTNCLKERNANNRNRLIGNKPEIAQPGSLNLDWLVTTFLN